MATTAPAIPAKVSWLKRIGQFFGKVLGIVATDAKPIEAIAKPVAEALLPQFVPLIEAADSIFSNIVKECVAAEAAAAAVGQAAGTGAAKLAVALSNVGPLVDNWISSNFPGAVQVSQVAKSGLVSAVVAILNEVQGTGIVVSGGPAPATSSAPAPAATTTGNVQATVVS
jgi:hypothetical protein